MGESVNLELLAKLVLDVQAEQKAVRVKGFRTPARHGRDEVLGGQASEKPQGAYR